MGTKQRAIVLIIDGFGVGGYGDSTANTYLSIMKVAKGEPFPNLHNMGLANLLNPRRAVPPSASYGKCRSAWGFTDTYNAYHEMMGLPPPRKEPKLGFENERSAIKVALETNGYTVQELGGSLIVNKRVYIGDATELDPGVAYLVSGAQEHVPFDDITNVALVVRAIATCSRVVAFGIPQVCNEDLLRAIQRNGRRIGIDLGMLKFNRSLALVRHFGVNFDHTLQAPHIISEAGKDVVFIGKSADILKCDGAKYYYETNTKRVFESIVTTLQHLNEGLIVATLIETDYFGHSSDVEGYLGALSLIDSLLGCLLTKLLAKDMLIITSDHGNDPSGGGTKHTPEWLPLLVWSGTHTPKNLGIRNSLSDIGNTITTSFGLQSTAYGREFWSEIQTL